MSRPLHCFASLICGLILSVLPSLRATEPSAADPWVEPAAALQAATVTIRVWADDEQPAAEPVDKESTADESQPSSTPAVTICSGVCVGNGRIVTAAALASDARIRLTLPGGAQADARVRVVDEFSGLSLLQSDKPQHPSIACAAEPPAVASGVLLASAWGVDQPTVSLGIVSGVDRQLRGAVLPPLLQCDLRTTSTSAGAGVVNSQGKLVGIVIASDSPETRRDGAYLIPASHVDRLIRLADKSDEPAADGAKAGAEKAAEKSVILLKRQRARVGMVLEGDEAAVVVRRLTHGGPADKAGLKIGDQILTSDGVAIRSVYQAVLPTMHKQPGDTLKFRVLRDDRTHSFEVVLGGGVELPDAPQQLLSQFIQPSLQFGRDRTGNIVTLKRERNLAEVAAPPLPSDAPPRTATTAEKLALLERALDRYQAVIELQQQQITTQKADRAKLEAELKTLREQLKPAR